MTGGTVSNCVVRNNACQHDGHGGGIRASGNSQILYCQIVDNRAGRDGDANGWGGGVWSQESTVLIRNCLIARNVTGTVNNQGYGAGVYMSDGLIESCTIVSNLLRRADGNGLGGGVYRNGNGSVKNCIIYFNRDVVEDVVDNYYGLDAGNTTYSCTTPALGGDNIADDPLFADLAGGDYHLKVKPVVSPCIDAGNPVAEAWMIGGTDLDGTARIQKGASFTLRVDMGAYEMYVAPAGTVILLR
jgi:hypothetical protein